MLHCRLLLIAPLLFDAHATQVAVSSEQISKRGLSNAFLDQQAGSQFVQQKAIVDSSGHVDLADQADQAKADQALNLELAKLNLELAQELEKVVGKLRQWLQGKSMTNATTLSNANIQAQGQSMTNAATLSKASSIQVMSSSGRLGNNMVWLIRGLRYAKLTNRDYLLVNISKKDKELSQLVQIMNEQALFKLSSMELPGAQSLKCEPWRLNLADEEVSSGDKASIYIYQGENCDGADAESYRYVAQGPLQHAFLPELQSCLKADDSNSQADEELTIHLRGQDLWGLKEYEYSSNISLDMNAYAHNWLWHQPPCTMYKKIIEEEGYKRVRIVTSSDLRHVCISWLMEKSKELGISVQVQATELMKDFCTLGRAENLVLSYSSLCDTAALISHRLKRLYVREFANQHSLLDCKLWPGTELHQYYMPIGPRDHRPYGTSYAEVIRWFTSYDEKNMTKYRGCGAPEGQVG